MLKPLTQRQPKSAMKEENNRKSTRKTVIKCNLQFEKDKISRMKSTRDGN